MDYPLRSRKSQRQSTSSSAASPPSASASNAESTSTAPSAPAPAPAALPRRAAPSPGSVATPVTSISQSSAASLASAASPSTSSRSRGSQRKSVSFDSPPAPPAQPTPLSGPSSSNSRSTRSNSKKVSSKALGKRRAASPTPADLPTTSKRRKTSTGSKAVSKSPSKTDEAKDDALSYNLRSRDSSFASPPKPKRSMPRNARSSASSSKGSTPAATPTTTSSSKRNQRAADKSTANMSLDPPSAPEDNDDAQQDDEPSFSGFSALPQDEDAMPVDREDDGSVASSAQDQIVGAAPEGDDDDDDEDNEDELDEDDEDAEDMYANEHFDEDMDDDYASEGELGDLHAPPQTYDEDGAPLSGAAARRAGLDDDDDDGAASSLAAALGIGGLRGLSSAFAPQPQRLRSLLSSLQSKDDDPSKKLIALQDLAELLSMGTEDTLAGYFQIDAFTKELIKILKGEAVSARSGDFGGEMGGMTREEMEAFGIAPPAGGAGVDEETNVQMMLLACRCLANMMEALPGSAHSVVYAGGVPVLCSKLLEIQYIDLAEQTLSTLEKVSEEMPSAIVREGGLNALLQYLDFFSTHVQRTAVTAAANSCRTVALDNFAKVAEVMPILKSTLSNPDKRVVEQGCLAVVRIVESFRHHADKLESLLSAELVQTLIMLLDPDSSNVASDIYSQVLKMLVTAARASATAATLLIESRVTDRLYQLLTGVNSPSDNEAESSGVVLRSSDKDDRLVLKTLVQRPREQVQETLALVCELLPPLPKDGIFDTKAPSKSTKESPVASGSAVPQPAIKQEEPEAVATDAGASEQALATSMPALPRTSSSSRSVQRSIRSSQKAAAIEKRLELLTQGSEERSKLVMRLYSLLLPILVDVYSASVNSTIRSKATLGMLKIVNFCDAVPLRTILTNVPMSSFLAAVLASPDQPQLITSALQLVELLLIKMPNEYQYIFRREGVMHELERLGNQDLIEPKPPTDPVAAIRGSGLARVLQQHPSSTESSSSTDPKQLPYADAVARDAIVLRARRLREEYDDSQTSQAEKAVDMLDTIRALSRQLGDAAASDLDRTGAKEALKRIVDLFADAVTPLSSFELLESGLVDGLLAFATGSSSLLSASDRQQLLVEAFSAQSAFSLLVRRLQESLSRLEEFEVALAYPSTSADVRRDGVSALTRQIRLRLVAENGSDVPRSCTNIVVSIHAIATLQAFNDYLRPRILAGTPAAALASASAPSFGFFESSRADTASRLSSSLGASESVLRSLEAALDGASATARAAAERSGASLSDANAPASSSAQASTENPSADAQSPRRSTRLGATKSSSSLRGADDSHDSTAEDEEEMRENSYCDGDEEMFESDFDAPPPASRDDRPVNVEVADDSGKIVASTPNGTRVGTPGAASKPSPAPSAAESSTRPSMPPKPRASYAAALQNESSDFHLEFTLGGRAVDLGTTVFGAVYRLTESSRDVWSQIHTIRYRKVPGATRKSEVDDDFTMAESAKHPDDPAAVVLPSSISPSGTQAKLLKLLRALHNINEEITDVTGKGATDEAAFVNNKLTAKLNRQLEEPMIVASDCLPDWAIDLPTYFPFLFPFDSRQTFMQSTSFGYSRLMQKWVGATRNDSSGRREDSLAFLGRLPRQKVRISRERTLESAFKIFELYGSSRAALEVEFFSEVGSGLGPTLEFYALVSQDFARKEYGLWRDDDANDGTDFVHSRTGLFPRPYFASGTEAQKQVLKTFRVLGQFVAKAFMDSRIIDINFSKPFMRLVLDQALPLNVAMVKTVDGSLGRSLEHLQKYAHTAASSGDRPVSLDDVTLEDLALDFTLPGYDVELKTGGRSIAVDESNVQEYIDLVTRWTLETGVRPQLDSFRKGFSTVYPVEDLKTFTPGELVAMTGAIEEDWSLETLVSATKADHGYTMDSRPVRDLLEVMSALTPLERREVLSFLTGAPRLPIGGFAALSPMLTVVRKDGGDGSLPSVMTCVNYIKLPSYSTRGIVKDRFMTAVRDGAGGFHLS